MHPLTDLLERRSLPEPDGRPLYAYRLTLPESEAIRQHLASVLLPEATVFSRETAALFCLFGADHWRRSYAGGPWSWEPILTALDADHLRPATAGYRHLQQLVVDGLRVLKRPLLQRHHREYLLTLGCEGGLPLQMVLQEATALRRYFRALFQAYRTYELQGRLSGGLRVRDLARHVAGELPLSMREGIVFELSEQLVETVLEHAARVSGADDPVAALDRLDPAWRENLPLELSDSVARAFLQQLLKDAGTVAARLTPQIRFRRWLERGLRLPEAAKDSASGASEQKGSAPVRHEWRVVGTLEFPDRIEPETVGAMFGLPAATVPDRFDLILHEPPDHVVPSARGRSRRHGEEVQLTLSVLHRGASMSAGAHAVRARSLILQASDGRRLVTSDFPGALALSDLPWVFSVPVDDETAAFEYRGEGTVSFNTPSMVVVAEPDVLLQPAGPADVVMDLGVLAGDRPRRVWEVRGSVEAYAPDGERYRLRTAVADAAVVGAHFLAGRQPAIPLSSATMFAGFPQLREVRPDGHVVSVPGREVQWRSSAPDARWTSDLGRAVGEGWIRRQMDGATVFRTRVTVLPPAMSVSTRAESSDRGVVEVRASDGAGIDVEPAIGCAVSVQPYAAGTRAAVEKQGVPPDRLVVRCVWPLRGQARFEVPTPLEHARFEDVRGRPAVEVLRIASSQLPYMRATAMSPDPDRTFLVEVVLDVPSASGWAVQAVPTRKERPLATVTGGGHELALGCMQPHVELLLSSTPRLDATVTLTIRADPPLAGAPVRMSVTRYDLAFDWNASETLHLGASDAARLTRAELGRLDCRAIPLLAPAQAAVPLLRVAEDAWQVDHERMTPGPWLVSSWDGLWCRVRPRLYVVPGDATTMATSALAQAMLEPDAPQRQLALASAVRQMVDDPTDAGWVLVEQMLQRCEEFPPSVFDALGYIVLNDDALAMTVLCMAERGQEALTRLFDATARLPMHWAAIPVRSWQSAIVRWLERQREILSEAGLVDEVAVTLCREATDRLAAEHLPWLSPTLEEGYHAVFERLPSAETLALYQRSYLKDQARRIFECINELPVEPEPSTGTPSARHIANLRDTLGDRLRTPEALGVMAVRRWQHPRNFELVNAPLLAAIAAVCNIELTPLAKLELRTIESMHLVWFTRLYTAAYHYGLAARFQGAWPD